jgi:hypothetical protein
MTTTDIYNMHFFMFACTYSIKSDMDCFINESILNFNYFDVF